MQKISILYDASQAVLSTYDPDEVLQRVLSIARDYFQLQNVAILLLNSETNKLHLKTQIGWSQSLEHVELELGQGLTGTAAALKRPICVDDVSQDPRYIACENSTRSELAIPLIIGDEVIGVLDCQSEHLAHFDSERVDLLTIFSTHASMAIRNARLHDLERRRATQLQAINAIAQQTTAVLDLKELFAKVCSLIQKSFDVAHVSVLLKDQDELIVRAHYGQLTPQIPEHGRLSAAEGPWGRTLELNKTLLENHTERNDPKHRLFEESRSTMTIPLVSFGQTLGVLVLDGRTTSAFNHADIQSLESVADICATAIQNANYVERVKQLAYLDGLTGIFNRRYFELRIIEEIERARRFEAGMAVIMVDIDHFKNLNDEFGHLLGDEVLRQVSSLFNSQLRKIDVVCRYGGEEFAILLSQTSRDRALSVADKLRRTVQLWQFPGVPRSVTISGGVGIFCDHGNSRDELVNAADSALYLAKKEGRNRVRIAPSPRKQLSTSSEGKSSAIRVGEHAE
jgi:diguanylate cyclase (GGDEF)-like protein